MPIARAPRPARLPATLLGRAEAAAALSFVAAAIHLAQTDPHVREWWAYGAFFIAAAVGQAALGVLVLRRTPPWLVLTGIAGNLAIVGMYVLSRTNGAPMGPHAGRPEGAGALDVACAVAELAAIVVLLGLLPERLARRTATLLALVGLALWTGRLTGMLL
jgi:hypothetical protein